MLKLLSNVLKAELEESLEPVLVTVLPPLLLLLVPLVLLAPLVSPALLVLPVLLEPVVDDGDSS